MQDKRGFTLLELLICVAILSCLTMFATLRFTPMSFQREKVALEALKLQTQAMEFEDEIGLNVNGFELRYNAQGHVNQARTLVFDRHQMIVELGWGRLVEK